MFFTSSTPLHTAGVAYRLLSPRPSPRVIEKPGIIIFGSAGIRPVGRVFPAPAPQAEQQLKSPAEMHGLPAPPLGMGRQMKAVSPASDEADIVIPAVHLPLHPRQGFKPVGKTVRPRAQALDGGQRLQGKGRKDLRVFKNPFPVPFILERDAFRERMDHQHLPSLQGPAPWPGRPVRLQIQQAHAGNVPDHGHHLPFIRKPASQDIQFLHVAEHQLAETGQILRRGREKAGPLPHLPHDAFIPPPLVPPACDVVQRIPARLPNFQIIMQAGHFRAAKPPHHGGTAGAEKVLNHRGSRVRVQFTGRGVQFLPAGTAVKHAAQQMQTLVRQ